MENHSQVSQLYGISQIYNLVMKQNSENWHVKQNSLSDYGAMGLRVGVSPSLP